eukprot:CAMPEP_0194027584 /NCGR_PEP_ID=MMETSP0009_2-20130614/1722_1 /TAXON_ID=210454 /ORGANISM="Grammatophora oceanica, Strain CCMP 410" /LENGTH=185 /DNA_ID=CAMNT_0038666709 /DNA_START=1288 /DNA_END=1845 /DNA_ORIENTATION=+
MICFSIAAATVVLLAILGSGKSQEAGGGTTKRGQQRALNKGGKKKGKGSSMYLLETIQVGTSDTITTLRDDDTEGLGDIFTWDRRNQIYATSELDQVSSSTLIGDNQGHCVRLTNQGDNSEWDCFFTIFFEEGQIHAHGPFNAGVTIDAITGGTGAYEDATGSMELSYAGEVGGVFAYNYVFHLD